MEEIQIKKSELREEIAKKIAALPAKEIAAKTKAIENRLFDFANFLEAKSETPVRLIFSSIPGSSISLMSAIIFRFW